MAYIRQNELPGRPRKSAPVQAADKARVLAQPTPDPGREAANRNDPSISRDARQWRQEWRRERYGRLRG